MVVILKLQIFKGSIIVLHSGDETSTHIFSVFISKLTLCFFYGIHVFLLLHHHKPGTDESHSI
jgi:hypothetical protein